MESNEYYESLDKRTREYKEWKANFELEQAKKPEGLGDVIKTITKATGIDKATLLRILQTFQNEGVLRRSMFDNSYQRLPFGSGAGVYTEKLMAYAEIVTPFLQALQNLRSIYLNKRKAGNRVRQPRAWSIPPRATK